MRKYCKGETFKEKRKIRKYKMKLKDEKTRGKY